MADIILGVIIAAAAAAAIFYLWKRRKKGCIGCSQQNCCQYHNCRQCNQQKQSRKDQ